MARSAKVCLVSGDFRLQTSLIAYSIHSAAQRQPLGLDKRMDRRDIDLRDSDLTRVRRRHWHLHLSHQIRGERRRKHDENGSKCQAFKLLSPCSIG